MNAERRSLEDKLYEVEAELEECRRKKSDSTTETRSPEPSSSNQEEDYRPPEIDNGIPDVPDIPEIEIPGVDPSAKRDKPSAERVARPLSLAQLWEERDSFMIRSQSWAYPESHLSLPHSVQATARLRASTLTCRAARVRAAMFNWEEFESRNWAMALLPACSSTA